MTIRNCKKLNFCLHLKISDSEIKFLDPKLTLDHPN